MSVLEPYTCWFCHFGWPKPIADIYDRYVKIAGTGAMHYGPAHIVWEDENFARDSVQWCLDDFEKLEAQHEPEELAAVKASLLALLELPDAVLDPNWDEAPPADWVMVKR